MYYGLLREPDVTSFVDNMDDDEDEPSTANTTATGSYLKWTGNGNERLKPLTSRIAWFVLFGFRYIALASPLVLMVEKYTLLPNPTKDC